MKILYIYNLYQQPGGENHWAESEPELMRARGHAVEVYHRDNREIPGFSLWQKASLLWQASWSDRTYREVRELVRHGRPDVAHVHNTLALVTPSVYYACRDEGVPVVQTLHNYRLLCPAGTLLRKGQVCEECIEHSLLRSVRYGCYRNSRAQSAAVAWMLYSHRRRGTWQDCIDAYLVLSEFMRRKVIEGGLPAEKIIVKPNFQEPDPGPRQTADGSAVYVGRLSAEKGVRTLLAAWRSLKNSPMLRVIGNGPLRRELEAAAKNGASGSIEFLGERPRAEVMEYLSRAAFLILPSEWYEGFPLVVLEAYACGVPVIASRMGAMEEIVDDGRTGLHFTPGDVEDLARKVEWARANSEKMEEIGRNARAEYESKYTAGKNYELLTAIYTGLRDRRPLPTN